MPFFSTELSSVSESFKKDFFFTAVCVGFFSSSELSSLSESFKNDFFLESGSAVVLCLSSELSSLSESDKDEFLFVDDAYADIGPSSLLEFLILSFENELLTSSLVLTPTFTTAFTVACTSSREAIWLLRRFSVLPSMAPKPNIAAADRSMLKSFDPSLAPPILVTSPSSKEAISLLRMFSVLVSMAPKPNIAAADRSILKSFDPPFDTPDLVSFPPSREAISLLRKFSVVLPSMAPKPNIAAAERSMLRSIDAPYLLLLTDFSFGDEFLLLSPPLNPNNAAAELSKLPDSCIDVRVSPSPRNRAAAELSKCEAVFSIPLLISGIDSVSLSFPFLSLCGLSPCTLSFALAIRCRTFSA